MPCCESKEQLENIRTKNIQMAMQVKDLQKKNYDQKANIDMLALEKVELEANNTISIDTIAFNRLEQEKEELQVELTDRNSEITRLQSELIKALLLVQQKPKEFDSVVTTPTQSSQSPEIITQLETQMAAAQLDNASLQQKIEGLQIEVQKAEK